MAASPSDLGSAMTMSGASDLSVNLISISQLTSSSYLVSFTSNGCFVQDTRTGKQIGTGHSCYDPQSNRLRISRNVTFLEQIPFYTLPISAPATNAFRPLNPFPDLFPSEQSSPPPPPPLPPIVKVYHCRPKGDSHVPVPGSSVPNASVPPDRRTRCYAVLEVKDKEIPPFVNSTGDESTQQELN
ncbi:hypothetical protein MRB53_012578 [Persea americana]|uniref:Uncharacterized protein n=1 Tax=Persea americana TaxID=3435 RepID=A0ACC2LY61_PERAE|nr:hypothetical protein MRB53_012578 [Persea americana]